jgi:hypothetical protein
MYILGRPYNAEIITAILATKWDEKRRMLRPIPESIQFRNWMGKIHLSTKIRIKIIVCQGMIKVPVQKVS